MGLLSGLATLPLAPVRGVVWVAERIEEEAERQERDPAPIRAELAALLKDLEEDRIDEETYGRREEELLDRWEAMAADDGDPWSGSPFPSASAPERVSGEDE